MHQINSDHTSYRGDAVNEILDAGAKAGIFDEMIVVIPNSTETSWWTGKWEDMVIEDLIPYIDENFRTIPDARYRMTAGCSMGGYGSMAIGLRNPDYFSGVVSFFGAISMGTAANRPLAVAEATSAEYMDYFTMYFTCGNQDTYTFGQPAIRLNQKLEEMGVDHFYFIENGEHNSAFYVPYFDDAFEYLRKNMYKMPSGSAASLINVDYSATSEALSVTFTADKAIKKFFNVIPASKYTKDTNPGVTIPVIATIKYEVKPGALSFLYATALAETKEAQVKFNVTFDDNNLIVTENVDLTSVLPKNAVVHHVDFHTQLLGRDHVSDAKIEELKVVGFDLPQTGDNSNIVLFAALLMASVVGMAILGKKKAAC